MASTAARRFAVLNASLPISQSNQPTDPCSAGNPNENIMHIVVTTDERINASEMLRDRLRESVIASLRQFSTQIADVDVQVTQLNVFTAGWFEQRCWIEAHLRGRQPISVEYDSISLNMAVDGALQKLVQVMEVVLDRSATEVAHTDAIRRVPAQVGSAASL